MRPGQLKPNDFELAILRRLAASEPWLAKFLEDLHVLSREFTGVGSFTKFLLDETNADSAPRHVGLKGCIAMPGVPNGLFAELFCQGEHPSMLEVASCGSDLWDGVYGGFSFQEPA